MFVRRATSRLAASLRYAAVLNRTQQHRHREPLSVQLYSTPPPDHGSRRYEDFYERLLKVYGSNDGRVSVAKFLEDVRATGLQETDPRLHSVFKRLQGDDFQQYSIEQSKHHFIDAVSSNVLLLEKALNGKLVIPEFHTFKEAINSIYYDCLSVEGGQNASYIPELSRVDPNLWGVSLCTVDGQRHWVGDSNTSFTMQSGNKCFTYALAVDEYGSEEVHRLIGKEPSGASFNSLFLNSEGKPHNPMINAGAMLLCAMLKPELSLTHKVDFVLQKYCRMAGEPERSIKCDIMTCDSEMDTAHKNYAILHYMKSMEVFPDNVSIEEILKFYTRLCSVEIDCRRGAVMAGTLANSGYCPITGEKVLGPGAVRDTLALMHSCGMYDSAGEFSFAVGLPAKSGVSGIILMVVPNVMGMCLYSPRVNKSGNSVKGLHFCKKLVEMFNFHNCDSLSLHTDKTDPRRRREESREMQITSLMYATGAGSLSSIQAYLMAGVDLGQSNYDGRTPLHVAAAEGHYDIVEFLVKRAKVPINSLDRWSRTPLDEATAFDHNEVVNLLRQNGARNGTFLHEDERNSTFASQQSQ